MRKIITFLLSVCLSVSAASAENITKTINSLNINKSAVSVSVKDVKTGYEVYSLNSKSPMLPASTLKLVTASAALNTLGYDYLFTTGLYKSTNNDLYLKLGADPFLTSSDLNKLMTDAKEKKIIEPKNIYIDDSIFDNVEWGEGWQWDDDLNPLMPKFSAYNLDSNLLKIEVIPNIDNTPASISVKPFYPLTFMNNVTTDRTSKNSLSVSRNNSISSNVLDIDGIVSKTEVIRIPVNNPKRYFTIRLDDSVRSKKIDYYKSYQNSVLPSKNVYLVSEITHEMPSALTAILKSSDNLVAESVFKLAGANWAEGKGTINNSLDMLSFYLKTLDISDEDIKIVDGSGVSKNNLMTSDFMATFLVKRAKAQDFENFKQYLPAPGEGTLKNRMLYFKDNLIAKTGTLSDTSAIAGYITTRKGNVYAFDIMINDAKSSPADKKNVEEQILRQIYTNY